ncbi:MAG: hypothetical protein FWE89_03985 [Syntrophaceae bacterium]|nr:hypothetical protein [Syntrophaceae bacterium]
MRRLLRIAVIGAVVIFLGLAAAGCGKKENPLPIRGVAAVTIFTAKAVPADVGINLSWSVQGTAAALFKVFRSEPVDCPTCPRDYRLLVQLPLNDNRLVREGEAGFRYLDRDVKGGAYGYQVVGCDSAGRCGPVSPEATISQDVEEGERKTP